MKKLFNLYIKINLVLFPLFFLPMVSESFGFGKNWFLFISGLVGLLIWLIDFLSQKNQVKINFGRGFGLFVVFLIWLTISYFRLSPSVKSTTLSDPAGFGTFVSLFIWYFLWLQLEQRKSWSSSLLFLTIAGIIVSLSSLLVFIMPDSTFPITLTQNNPFIIIDKNWSFIGSILFEAVFLLFLAIENGRLMAKSSQKGSKSFILSLFKLSIISFGTILAIYRLFKAGWPGLDYVIGWQITADTFKNSPIFGVGIGNFLRAFNLFRPFSYNTTPWWNQRFIVSSSGFFHYWTELGIVFVVLLALFSNRLLKLKKSAAYISIIFLFLANLILPVNIVSLWLFAFILSQKFGNLSTVPAKFIVGEQKINIMPIITSLLVSLFILLGTFVSTKKLLARVYLRNSLLAASKNDGISTYDLQIKAISLDPTWAELRRIYSQTNIGLAQSLSQQQDLPEVDKEKISVLLQQAIREAKDTVSLDQTSAIYWNNLASIYKTLIGSVEGAPDWALESFQQAALLDQADPLVRMEMGSLYFSANQFENADRLFEEVLLRKGDFANGWYNWAHTAKNMNRLADAVTRLNQALLLVPIDSTDYDKASKELASWRAELEKLTAASQPQPQLEPDEQILKTAEPLPTVTNEINLPSQDLEPPQAKDLSSSSPVNQPEEPTITPQANLPQEETGEFLPDQEP